MLSPRRTEHKIALFRNGATTEHGIVFLEQVREGEPTFFRCNRAAQEDVILRDLLENGVSSVERLVDHVWHGREDGGPVGAEKQIAIIVCSLRKRLKPGWFIVARNKGYSLVWCPDAAPSLEGWLDGLPDSRNYGA